MPRRLLIFLFAFAFAALVILSLIQLNNGLGLSRTPDIIIKGSFFSHWDVVENISSLNSSLMTIDPIFKNGYYFNPYTSNLLLIDKSFANRCCGQPNVVLYLDSREKVFWAAVSGAMFGPFRYSQFAYEQKCISSSRQCRGEPDGSVCTTGIWCDALGRFCGGESCTGLGVGRCLDGKCVAMCESCPLYSPPNSTWCQKGEIVEGEDIFDEAGDCYCPGLPLCVID